MSTSREVSGMVGSVSARVVLLLAASCSGGGSSPTSDARVAVNVDGAADADPGAMDGGSDAAASSCGDPAAVAGFTVAEDQAILLPRSTETVQGLDNIYAPEILRLGPRLCLMYYGGQGADGHDRIFLATASDCHHWKHYPDDANPVPVLDNGASNHVNDPSVVAVDGVFYMYYTDAATGIDDRIHLATSTDGITWTKHGLVLDIGPDGTWDDFKVGRPAVLHREGVFLLYYDGNDGEERNFGLATSTDGFTFTKHPVNPMGRAGAIDVEVAVGPGGAETWILLHESATGVDALTSADGVTWCDQGRIGELSGQAWDLHGHVTPFVHLGEEGDLEAIYVGGASDPCWCKNRIGLLLPTGASLPADPSAGCDGCLAGQPDCTTACRSADLGVDGYCAFPGSVDPGACCACEEIP